MRFLMLCLLSGLFVFASEMRYFAGAGLNFGTPTLKIERKIFGRTQQTSIFNSKFYLANLTGGVQQYWDRDGIVGGRVVGEFGMGGASIEGKIAGVFSLSAALDLLIDFLKQDYTSLGIFGGFEYGMMFLVSQEKIQNYELKSETYGAYWRIGASVTFERFHRIDLTYKIPFSPLALPIAVHQQESRHQVYSGGQFCLGYKLLF